MTKTPGKTERATLQALIDAQHKMLQNAFEQVKMAQADRDMWYDLFNKRVVLCEHIYDMLSEVSNDSQFAQLLPRHQDAIKRMITYLGD